MIRTGFLSIIRRLVLYT